METQWMASPVLRKVAEAVNIMWSYAPCKRGNAKK